MRFDKQPNRWSEKKLQVDAVRSITAPASESESEANELCVSKKPPPAKKARPQIKESSSEEETEFSSEFYLNDNDTPSSPAKPRRNLCLLENQARDEQTYLKRDFKWRKQSQNSKNELLRMSIEHLSSSQKIVLLTRYKQQYLGLTCKNKSPTVKACFVPTAFVFVLSPSVSDDDDEEVVFLITGVDTGAAACLGILLCCGFSSSESDSDDSELDFFAASFVATCSFLTVRTCRGRLWFCSFPSSEESDVTGNFTAACVFNAGFGCSFSLSESDDDESLSDATGFF
uniref:Uncharacterized protein n=1 Tax=Romanomermis culicivorax TaxID=13658 RepID=A0A915IMK9_ROMCU